MVSAPRSAVTARGHVTGRSVHTGARGAGPLLVAQCLPRVACRGASAHLLTRRCSRLSGTWYALAFRVTVETTAFVRVGASGKGNMTLDGYNNSACIVSSVWQRRFINVHTTGQRTHIIKQRHTTGDSVKPLSQYIHYASYVCIM